MLSGSMSVLGFSFQPQWVAVGRRTVSDADCSRGNVLAEIKENCHMSSVVYTVFLAATVTCHQSEHLAT